MKREAKTPVPASGDVVLLREGMQSAMGIGITAAQDWCAGAVHTSRRAWQQWETGDRRMHPAFWELVRIKVGSVVKPKAAKRPVRVKVAGVGTHG